MRTINMDSIRSWDKLKDDIFHQRKEQHKANLRNQAKKTEPIKLKKIFPWRALTKLTFVTGFVYFAYNYTQSLIDQAIKKKMFTAVDLISLKVLKEDAWVKIKTLIKNPKQISKLSHLSNYMFQNELQKDLLYLKRVYPTHKLKSTLQSRLKIWILQFHNYQKSHYINEFGDVIEREQNSFLRIWRYPIFKDRKQKVIEEQRLHQYYRTIISPNTEQKQQKTILQSEISRKCERINVLNRFSQHYEDLLVQCRKNESIGNAIVQHLNYRKKLYPYPDIKLENN